MEINYDKIYIINVWGLKTNAAHPDTKITKTWCLIIFVMGGNFTSVFLLFIYNIFFYDLTINDFSKTCQDCIISFVYVVITFQYVVLVLNRDRLRKLKKAVALDFELSRLLPLSEQKIVLEYALKGQGVCKQWLVLCILGGGIFPVKNLFLIAYTWYKTGQVILLPVYYLYVYFPPSLNENKDTFTGWLIIMIIWIAYCFVAITVYTSFIPLGPSYMLHMCGQLEVIKGRIDVLFKSNDLEQIKNDLHCIIRHLQYIYTFVNELQLVVRITYQLTIVVSCVYLPITSFEIIESLRKGQPNMEFLSFFVGCILFIASPCYYSDLLMEKGEKVRLAVYSCGWEKLYERSLRSTILLVLLRAQRPVAVKTPFSTMSLQTLSEVFHQSYALFNLMNAAWRQRENN